MKNRGGIRPGILLSSFSSLFEDLDHARSTRLLVPLKTSTMPGRLAYLCFFCLRGLGARGSDPRITGPSGPNYGSPLRRHFFLVPCRGLSVAYLYLRYIYLCGGWATPAPRHVWPVSSAICFYGSGWANRFCGTLGQLAPVTFVFHGGWAKPAPRHV